MFLITRGELNKGLRHCQPQRKLELRLAGNYKSAFQTTKTTNLPNLFFILIFSHYYIFYVVPDTLNKDEI